jgi:thiamine-phosphate pyrophosphorylase
MSEDTAPEGRCRLIVVAPPEKDVEESLSQALEGGDVASVVLAAGDLDPASYARHCHELVGLVQARDVAAIVVDDTVAAGRSGADGILLQRHVEDRKQVIARFSPHKLVGLGGFFTRHRAIELGEAEPDFLLFGKIDGDLRPDAHPKNLALGEWWSKMIEIPCVVMAGNRIDSIAECASCGAEFVAAGRAIFEFEKGPREAVRLANEILDEQARNVAT